MDGVTNTMVASQPYPTGGTDLGSSLINNLPFIIGGAANLATAQPGYNLARQYAGQATQGSQSAIDRMTAFLNDPSSVTRWPGYEFGMNQGMEAVNRGAGASGLLNSGNRLLALQDFGQAYAGSWIDRLWNMMQGNVNATLGAGELDLRAGNMLLGANQQRGQTIGSGLGALAGGILGGGMNSPLMQIIRLATGGGGGSSGDIVTDPSNPNFIGPPEPGGISGTESGWPGSYGDLVPTPWTGGFDLPGGGDLSGWTSGFDLLGG